MQEKNMGHICPMGRSRVKDLRISPAAKKAASKAKDRRSQARHSALTGIIGKHTPPARTLQHQGRPYQRPPSSSMAATNNPRMDQVLTTQSTPQHSGEPDLSASDSSEDMEVNQTIQESSDEFSPSGVTSSSSTEDSDFTTVSHKRQRTDSLPSSVRGEDLPKDYCTFRIIPTECSSEMEVLALLFCEHPRLECARRQIQNRSVLLVAKTKVASQILSGTTSLNGKAVKFEKMGDKSNLRTGVLHHVPLFITEDAILYTEKIVSASRMLRWDQTSQQKVATEMVKFQYEGALPARIKLGLCGSFKVRPFVPTPTRCYKCQKFGTLPQRACQKQLAAGFVRGPI